MLGTPLSGGAETVFGGIDNRKAGKTSTMYVSVGPFVLVSEVGGMRRRWYRRPMSSTCARWMFPMRVPVAMEPPTHALSVFGERAWRGAGREVDALDVVLVSEEGPAPTVD